MEEEINLMDMIKYFWSKKRCFVIVGIICVVLAIVYSKTLIKPEYMATSSFILTNDGLKMEEEIYAYAKLPDRYYAIVNSQKVLDKAIENLKLDIEDIFKFKEENILVYNVPASFIIKASVTTDDAKKSADIANEIIKVSIEEIKKIYGDEEIQILDIARENWEPVSDGIMIYMIKFILVGEVLVCGYVMIRYIFVENKNKKEENDENKK